MSNSGGQLVRRGAPPHGDGAITLQDHGIGKRTCQTDLRRGKLRSECNRNGRQNTFHIPNLHYTTNACGTRSVNEFCAQWAALHLDGKSAERGDKSRRSRLCVRRSRLRENSSWVQQEKTAPDQMTTSGDSYPMRLRTRPFEKAQMLFCSDAQMPRSVKTAPAVLTARVPRISCGT